MNFEEDWYPEDEECFRCGGLDTTYRDMLGYCWHPECREEHENEARRMFRLVEEVTAQSRGEVTSWSRPLHFATSNC